MSDYQHEWENKEARFLVMTIHGYPQEFIEKRNALDCFMANVGSSFTERYTAQQMELEALNEGWVLWNMGEKTPSLYLKVKTKGENISREDTRISHNWHWSLTGKELIIAYRLSNADGYKDGVKVADFESVAAKAKDILSDVDAKLDKCLAAHKAEWIDGLPPVGEVCEAAWLEAPDGGSREWCEVTYKRDFDSKVWFRHGDDEIILHTFHVEFRPIQSERDKTIEAAMSGLNDSLQLTYQSKEVQDTVLQTVHAIADLGFLSIPKGDK